MDETPDLTQQVIAHERKRAEEHVAEQVALIRRHCDGITRDLDGATLVSSSARRLSAAATLLVEFAAKTDAYRGLNRP